MTAAVPAPTALCRCKHVAYTHAAAAGPCYATACGCRLFRANTGACPQCHGSGWACDETGMDVYRCQCTGLEERKAS